MHRGRKRYVTKKPDKQSEKQLQRRKTAVFPACADGTSIYTSRLGCGIATRVSRERPKNPLLPLIFALTPEIERFA